MEKILEVKEETVTIGLNGLSYEVDKKLLNFSPEAGDSVETYKNLDGVITNVLKRENKKKEKSEWEILSIVSIVFGSLGFFPLMFVGSIVGFITGLIGIINENEFKGRAKIGFWLSIGSFAMWVLLISLKIFL